MDLHLKLEIGDELKPVAKVLGAYTQLLDDLDNSSRSQNSGSLDQSAPLLDLGLDIRASLNLMQ
jgi:hypothetical protein